jgi:hypothetical protein
MASPQRRTNAMRRRRRPENRRLQRRETAGDARPHWTQTLTSLATLVSVLLVAAGLYYTNSANRAQFGLAEQGQFTDRFGKAIDQLGAKGIDVRLGGIYSLERLMHDSPRDGGPVVEVLCAYLRGHAPRTKEVHHDGAGYATQPADLAAVRTVLHRRPARIPTPVDLRDSDLTGLRFAKGNLAGANLQSGDLLRADLSETDLSRADLNSAYLVWTDLRRASLTRANLRRALLANADLRGADLRGADLTDAELQAADLRSADLTDAMVLGADFREADLRGAKITASQLKQVALSPGSQLPTDR